MAEGAYAEKKPKKGILEQAKTRYAYCIEAEKYREDQRDDLRFYAGNPDNGWQWPTSIKHKRETGATPRPCLTVNKLPQHVHQVTNEQRQNRPAIKVLPVDDKSDPEVAEKLSGICRHIESASDADVAYDNACERQVIHGEGFWRIVTDYVDDKSFDQEIFIRAIRNSFRAHLDPDCQSPCGEDAKYGFIDEMLPEDDFATLYPNAEKVDWDEADSMPHWYERAGKKVRICEYFYCEYEPATLYQWADGQVTEYPIEGYTPVAERKVSKKKVKWCKLTGQEVLEERDWAGKWIPIVRVVGNELDVDGELVVSGLVRNAKDAQRMYNYYNSQEAEWSALAPKVPYVGAEGQFEGYERKWASANTDNHAYLEYKPVTEEGTVLPAPQRQSPPMMPAAFIQAKVAASDDIKATTGQYDASIGARSNETSGRAIMARQREGDVSTFHYIDNLSRAIRHTGRILVDLIPKIYDRARVARILGEDGEPDQVRLDPGISVPIQPVMGIQNGQNVEIERLYNPSIGKYDVAVSVGPSYTTKRQEAAAAMTEISRAIPKLWDVAGDVIVKNQDWPGADEIAKRLKAVMPPQVSAAENGENPELMQAQQIIRQLQQQLQAVAKSIEAQNARNDHMELLIKGYDAETKRIKETAAAMSPMQIQAIVMDTLQQVLNGPGIGPMQ